MDGMSISLSEESHWTGYILHPCVLESRATQLLAKAEMRSRDQRHRRRETISRTSGSLLTVDETTGVESIEDNVETAGSDDNRDARMRSEEVCRTQPLHQELRGGVPVNIALGLLTSGHTWRGSEPGPISGEPSRNPLPDIPTGFRNRLPTWF